MFDTSLRRFKDQVGALATRMSRVSPMFISVLALVVGLLASYAAKTAISLGIWSLASQPCIDGLDGLGRIACISAKATSVDMSISSSIL
jgi:hypothetical protein